MPVYVIDTLKPKNGLDFPVVEAVDVAVEGYASLADAVSHFATDTAIATITAALEEKADTSDITNLQAQINQIEISASAESVVAPEVAAARVGADSTTYQTLKARLDAEKNDSQNDINTIVEMIDTKSNMYNKNSNKNKSGGYYTSSGSYMPSSGYWVSHPIEVIKGLEYKVTHSILVGSNPVVVYVNDDGDIISSFSGEISGDVLTFTPPKSGKISVNLGMGVEKNTVVLSRSADFESGLQYFSLNNLPEIVGSINDSIAAVSDSIDTHSNLFNKNDDCNKTGGYYTTQGTYVSATGYWVSHPIEVIEGITYKATHPVLAIGSNDIIVYVNDEGEILSSFSGTINDNVLQFTAPTTGTVSVNLGKTADIDNFVVAKSEDYQEGLPYFSIQELPDEIDQINESISSVEDEIDSLGDVYLSKIHSQSVNLYDNTDYVSGKYIATNGNIVNGNGYAYTGIIELEAGSYVTLEYSVAYGGNAIHYFECDSSGTIQAVKSFTELEQEGNVRIVTFTLLQKSYIRLNTMASVVQDLMVCVGDTISDYPDSFVPYLNENKVEENVHLSDTMKADVAQIVADNPLSGKMISAEGDSICYGNGYIGGYAKIIADENNMSYQNGAVGGGTIASGTYISGTETPRHWICRAINAMSSSADYIIIEGGVNDGSLQVPLGEITSGYNATLDDSTFYGALESIFKQVNMKFKEKKYCFLIPHQMTYSMTPKGNYYKAIYDCAEKWGMPICDLSKMVPPFGLFAANSDLREDLTDVYTTAGDGWHPTEQCYRKYYVDKITSFLKSL